jgi:PAS domain S-box-containing protein
MTESDAAQRQRFLLTLTDVLRGCGDTRAILQEVSAMLGRHFRVNRVGYGHVDERLDLIDYDVCWTDGSVPPLMGRFPASAFGQPVIDRLRAGEPVVIANVRHHALTSDAATIRTSHEVDTRAILVVPLFTAGRLRTIVYLNQRAERPWTPHEVELMNEVAERTRELIERGRAEQALRESEARWRGLFERMGEGFFIGEAVRDDAGRMVDFRFVEVNPAFERLTGIPVNQALGRTVREAVPGLQDEVIDTYARVVDTGESAEFELHVPALNDRWYEARARAIGSDQFSVLFLEITQRKATESALMLSEKRFRLMADAVPQIVWITDAEGRTEFFNRHWYAYTGLAGYPGTAAEVAVSVVHPDDRQVTMERFNQARATGTAFNVEHRIRAASGDYRWFLVRAEPYEDPASGCVTQWYGSSVDIHDRKLAEESLRASEARYRTLFESIDEGFCILQMVLDGAGRAHDYRFLEINPAFERHTGMAGALGRTIRELVPGIEPSWVETYGRVARTGEPLRFEEHAPSMGRWFDVFAFRVGEPREHKVALLFSDVTQRRRAEQALREREAELREADARKDEFLATLAHELRNPLAPISNGLAILRHADPASPVGVRARELMERQLMHMVRLVDDLLDVSRVSRGKVALKKATVSLNAVVEQALETSRPLIESARHALSVELPQEPVLLHADATRLAQVLGNLLNNAAKYTPEGGRIALRAERRPGERLSLSVSDNGMGIPADMLGQVFDLFTQVGSTLDRSQGGLGIGLSLARRLVEMHGGHISAESAGPNRGSTFVVDLPIGRPPAAAPAGMGGAPAGGADGVACRRVLVVDDNVDAAETLALLLRMDGHEVHVVHDGLQAIAAAQAHLPELVFLDIGMPVLNGYEVAARLRAIPALAQTVLVAVTGWGTERDQVRTRAAGIDGHLTKPVREEDLARALELRR